MVKGGAGGAWSEQVQGILFRQEMNQIEVDFTTWFPACPAHTFSCGTVPICHRTKQ